ncbi:MAG: hypothetical protein ACLFPS_05915 [Clostridia bacterium]
MNFKDKKKIGKNIYCSECYKKLKTNHRKKLLEKPELKEEINNLRRIEAKRYREINRKEINKRANKAYHKKKPTATYYKPKVKGAKIKKEKKLYNNLNLRESQALFKILIKNGLSYEEADKRVKDLKKYQKELFQRLKSENKSEKEISEAFKKEFDKLVYS